MFKMCRYSIICCRYVDKSVDVTLKTNLHCASVRRAAKGRGGTWRAWSPSHPCTASGAGTRGRSGGAGGRGRAWCPPPPTCAWWPAARPCHAPPSHAGGRGSSLNITETNENKAVLKISMCTTARCLDLNRCIKHLCNIE